MIKFFMTHTTNYLSDLFEWLENAILGLLLPRLLVIFDHSGTQNRKLTAQSPDRVDAISRDCRELDPTTTTRFDRV